MASMIISQRLIIVALYGGFEVFLSLEIISFVIVDAATMDIVSSYIMHVQIHLVFIVLHDTYVRVHIHSC